MTTSCCIQRRSSAVVAAAAVATRHLLDVRVHCWCCCCSEGEKNRSRASLLLLDLRTPVCIFPLSLSFFLRESYQLAVRIHTAERERERERSPALKGVLVRGCYVRVRIPLFRQSGARDVQAAHERGYGTTVMWCSDRVCV